jgi:hypothetical protein
MPGRLSNNLRSGNLAERLGFHLLRGVAAIAEVPREEDVGIDAIATLLRYDTDGCSYAEDTFLVQIKAESEEEISYRGHGFEWFAQQTLPMFIGRVSQRQQQSISVYSTIFAHQAIRSLHATEIQLRFGVSNLPPTMREQLWCPWTIESERPVVWLGDPILRWTVSEIPDRVWKNTAYSTFKKFIALVQIERLKVSLGQISRLNWKTNIADSLTVSTGFMLSHADHLPAVALHCSPALNALSACAFCLPGDAGEQLARSLVSLAGALRTTGIEIDPENFFRIALAAQISKQEVERQRTPDFVESDDIQSSSE